MNPSRVDTRKETPRSQESHVGAPYRHHRTEPVKLRVRQSRIRQAATIEALAEALRFPVSFFSQPDPVELQSDGVSFRALKSMTASQRDAALAAGSLAVD